MDPIMAAMLKIVGSSLAGAVVKRTTADIVKYFRGSKGLQEANRIMEDAYNNALASLRTDLDMNALRSLKAVLRKFIDDDVAAELLLNAAIMQREPPIAALSTILETLGYSLLELSIPVEVIVECISSELQKSLLCLLTDTGDLQGIVTTSLLSNLTQNMETLVQHMSEAREERQQASSDNCAPPFWGIFEAASKALQKFDVDSALRLLEQLRLDHWDQCSPTYRSLILSKLARGYELSGRTDEACQLRLEAADWVRGTREARVQEAFAFANLGKIPEAFEIAEKLVAEMPYTPDGWNIWVQTAPTEKTCAEIEQKIPTSVIEHEDVLIGLAGRALRAGHIEEAERYARRTVERAPWSPKAKEVLALIILSRYRDCSLESQPGSTERTRIEDAKSLLEEIIDKHGTHAPKEYIARVRNMRAQCLQVLGHKRDALQEMQLAYTLLPGDSHIVREYARLLTEQGLRGDAIDVLEQFTKVNISTPCALDYIERLMNMCPTEYDRILAAVDLALADSGAEEGYRLILLSHGIQVAHSKGDEDKLATYLLKSKEVGEIAGHIINSELRRLKEDNDGACAYALRAVDILSAECDVVYRRYLGALLMRLHLYSQALEVWRLLLFPGMLTPETVLALRCANECKLYKDVLIICQNLRTSGVYDIRCFNYEVEALEECGEYNKEVLVTKEYMLQPFDENIRRHLRMNLARLGLHLQIADLCNVDPDALPSHSAEDVTPGKGRLIVDMLCGLGHGEKALQYAYSLYRRFPDELEANQALAFQILHSQKQAPEKLDTVGVGMAVEYESSGHAQKQWVVIEDEPNPVGSRDEYSPHHPLCRSLIGKRVGDEFIIQEGLLKPETGYVTNIMPKAVFRALRCVEGMPRRFGAASGVQMFSVEGKGDEEFDLTPLLSMMEESEREMSEALEFIERYAAHPLPISFCARIVKRHVFEVMCSLKTGAGTDIACCEGSRDEHEKAILEFHNAEALVLDESAITTLALAERSALLRSLPKRCIVTQNTLLDIKHVLTSNRLGGGMRVFMRQKGRVTLGMMPPEQEEALREKLTVAVEIMESVCEITGGSAVQELSPEMRQELSSFLRQSTVEAVALSQLPGHVLWTDDGILARIVDYRLGNCRRVWSQLVCLEQLEAGGISSSEYASLSVSLARMGLEYVFIDHRIVCAVAEDAHYDPHSPGISLLMDVASARCQNRAAVVGICAPLVRDAWQKCVLPLRCGSLTDAVLARLFKLPNARIHISDLRDCLSSAFSLDVINGMRCLAHVDAWIGTNPF